MLDHSTQKKRTFQTQKQKQSQQSLTHFFEKMIDDADGYEDMKLQKAGKN